MRIIGFQEQLHIVRIDLKIVVSESLDEPTEVVVVIVALRCVVKQQNYAVYRIP